MVRKRLITILTVNDGILFRTRNFIPDYRYTLNFVDAWSVDEVVLLDITRPGEGDRNNFYEIVQSFARNCFVPLTVGGGVRDISDFRTLLNVGADKVALNTMAIHNPGLLSEAARLYGSQCVVVCIDAKRKADGTHEAYSHFGTQPAGVLAEDVARSAQEHDAGEILVQSIDHDGMLEGYDLELIKKVNDAVSIPVLAASGAGNWQHFVDAIATAGASAACTSNIYHFTEPSIQSAKKFMKRNGIDVRIEGDANDQHP